MEFMKLVLSRVNSSCFKGTTEFNMFHHLVTGNYFDLARVLVQGGVSVDCCKSYSGTALYSAVTGNNVRTIRFLLSLGADSTA